MPCLPVVHTPEEDLIFFQSHVLPKTAVTVLSVSGHPAAFVSCTPGRIEHLYVAPEHWRRGYGAALLNSARTFQEEFQLWTFQENRQARRFYAALGFREVEFTDGSRNEERTPDVRLVWRSGLSRKTAAPCARG